MTVPSSLIFSSGVSSIIKYSPPLFTFTLIICFARACTYLTHCTQSPISSPSAETIKSPAIRPASSAGNPECKLPMMAGTLNFSGVMPILFNKPCSARSSIDKPSKLIVRILTTDPSRTLISTLPASIILLTKPSTTMVHVFVSRESTATISTPS